MFDYTALVQKINEFGGRSKLVKEIGMDRTTLWAKLSGKTDFRQDEIFRICYVLDIPLEQIPFYFFTEIVKKSKLSDHHTTGE